MYKQKLSTKCLPSTIITLGFPVKISWGSKMFCVTSTLQYHFWGGIFKYSVNKVKITKRDECHKLQVITLSNARRFTNSV